MLILRCRLEDLRSLFKASRKFTTGIRNSLQRKDADIWLTVDDDFHSNGNDINLFLVEFASKITNLKIREPAKRYEHINSVYFAGDNVRKCIFDWNIRGRIPDKLVAENIIFFRSLNFLKIYRFEVDTRSLEAILDAITGLEIFEIDLSWSRLNEVPLAKLLSIWKI